MMVGPTLQQDVFMMLIKFRKWQYVLTADVQKMYRQVLIHEKYRSLQRILWRGDKEANVQIFELNTVTYGTACAPFLAVRSLQEIAKLNQVRRPLGASRILSDFYVDDLVTGANTILELVAIKEEINTILNEAGFCLHKWASNHFAVIKDLSLLSSNNILKFDKDFNISTLGLQWNSKEDQFRFFINGSKQVKTASKRTILSSIAHIFDPLGLIGPVITTAKIFMQRLWQLKLDWDEAVPLDIQTKWQQYESELPQLNQLRIARNVIVHNNVKELELHSFADASERAYGACVYIRSTDSNNHYHTSIVCSKSRIAPLRNSSLPRLELCAALLAAQLTHKVLQSIELKFDRMCYWSDSTITLTWIKSCTRKWTTFVANRVSLIQKLSSPDDWHYVESLKNPADIISRGMSPASLIDSKLWWEGPTWLADNSYKWTNDMPSIEQELPEQRKATFTLSVGRPIWDLYDKYSTFHKLIRITAYCLRFINNSQIHKPKLKGPLEVNELEAATQRLTKNVQSIIFAQELRSLQLKEALPNNSKLLSLNPFLDKTGLIRVGGRLQNSNLPYSSKHQLVLPSKHPFTRLLIEREHIRLLHAGAQTTLAAIRQKFWPLNGRSIIRQMIHKCVKCFKTNPESVQPIMGNLPEQRVQPSRPFTNTGIDFCGPFRVRESRRRNAKTITSYVAVFVCFAVKAVHLELAFDLTTESFLNILKRFIARRGKPSNIFSDNATTFVRANKDLKEFLTEFTKRDYQDKLFNTAAEEGIKWHFIPPRAPNFGGIWEASVKAFKSHLKRVAGASLLTIEEMQTLAVQIESILNSRPLTPLSNDPNDLSYISPRHFLIGDTLTALPETALLDVKENRLSRWQRVEQMKQHFWSRWSKDYLNQLQQRNKWRKEGVSIKQGDLVLLREDNTPPLYWPIGRIQEVHPGNDGVIRAATIKTSKGLFKRSSNRLCLFPTNN